MLTDLEKEELYQKALKRLDYFKNNEDAYVSVSTIQRMLRVGYITAAKIVDRMEEEGYVSEYVPGRPRKLLKTL